MGLSKYFTKSKSTIEETLGQLKGTSELGKTEITLIAEYAATFDIVYWALEQDLTLSHNKTLHLRHYNNKVDSESIKSICQAIKVGAEICCLNLFDTNIGNVGVNLLAKVLESGVELKRLYLRRCQVGVEGVRALTKAIKAGTNLKILDLSWNNIGNESAALLAGALESKNEIQKLILRNCNISFEGAKSLAKALPLSKLTILDLSSNNIENRRAEVLAQALECGTKLQNLHLEGNRIDIKGRRSLARALRLGVLTCKLSSYSPPSC